MADRYIHGHEPREHGRLHDQAGTLADLIHADTRYPPGSTVLEAGCGVGAQTVLLARSSPGAAITAIDVSESALAAARIRMEREGLAGALFFRANIMALPFPPASFDHVFLCFVLEHLSRPAEALARLTAVLKPGGTLTAIEGDHGTILFHPDSAAARRAIAAQVELQRRAGGDPTIGRRLEALLSGVGLEQVRVSPHTVAADASRPDLQDSFTERTFTAMISGIREGALAAGLADAEDFDAGLAALRRTAEPDGTFRYTFFKGVGRKARATATMSIRTESPLPPHPNRP